MAGTVSFRWTTSPDVLARKVGDYGTRLLKACYALAQVFAAKIETWAKANARWVDRTGNARQGLTGRAFATATGVAIYLFGTVSYQIYLELAHQGRFGIILKAMQTHYGPLMQALQRLVGR